MPTHFYDKAMLGLPGRDEQIENYQTTIRNVGRAGVPVLGYHFMPNSVWTTDRRAKTRGGATARKFDMAAVDAVADSVVKMKKMMPTTLGRAVDDAGCSPRATRSSPKRRCGRTTSTSSRRCCRSPRRPASRLALHPDDPPVPMLGGVARLFYKPANFKKAYEIAGAQRRPGRSTSASAAARR